MAAEQTESKTKHTCNPDNPGMPKPFGRKAPEGECPRCDELHAGAPARRPDWVDRLGSRARDEAATSAEIRAHFADPNHRAKCGPVCTAFDW